MIEQQLEELRERLRQKSPNTVVESQQMPNGGALIKVSNVDLNGGWNRPTAEVLFVAPPGYPGAAPDCFWVEPGGLRLANGATPQASNDGNPIPGDPMAGRSTTWFSWHVQGWNPNVNTLAGFYQLILDRLRPAR
ncbi:E2/UBC family protein [Trinickia mobilis]|uniref:E2/UBC family protein n=1 Tax=Trinickia mobilis TaxID=2816356 RepID=UPI001A8C8D1A|nr:E2/UBC family protein [Trinickia mobilis]